uniref:RUS1 family protein C16orf58 homolog n=1 Tax=Haemonchus contortus TaxID=6289 RepID=A0A7I4Y719_HAECO
MADAFTENYAGRPVRKVFCKSGQSSLTVGYSTTTSSPHNTDLLGTIFFYLTSIKSTLIDIFLPQGYPYSVSEDYLQYQIWDTLQAFASSMTGALATEAVLKGAGVGDQTASALAASLTWLAKDGLGMVGRIAFGFFKGSELDSDCKKWRLVADIMNDLAFFIDLLSPAFSGPFFVCACTSSILRCVVGVAGGATRTAIIQHQARRNNLADVASKDGSQETMVNVTALLASFILLPLVSGKQATIWLLFLVFTLIHLYANYRAVRSLNMETLNLKLATLLIRTWLESGKVMSVTECNKREPLFSSFGTRYLGCSLSHLLSYQNKVPSAKLRTTDTYTLLIDTRRNIGWIALTDNGSEHSSLRAIFDLEALARDANCTEKDFNSFLDQLHTHKWRTDGNNLGFDEWTYSTK